MKYNTYIQYRNLFIYTICHVRLYTARSCVFKNTYQIHILRCVAVLTSINENYMLDYGVHSALTKLVQRRFCIKYDDGFFKLFQTSTSVRVPHV